MNKLHSRDSVNRLAIPSSAALLLLLAVCAIPVPSTAQTAADVRPATQASETAPLTITLQDALQRAKENSVPLQSAYTDLGLAHEDRVQGRAALLPSLTYSNQYIYTQGNATPTPRFIANNAVHEYASQGNAHEALGVAQFADYRRRAAAEAVARARFEIAARGLVTTVVQTYYTLIASERKYASSQLAAAEAANFLKISQQLERGGEVAHSDVIKAQLQYNDRQRDLREAELAMKKSRLDLAVLLFRDFNQNFTVVDDTQLPPPLPPLEQVAQAARSGNPDLRAASASVVQANAEVAAARGEYFPSLAVDYFYGIDASQFAVRNRDGMRNLGNSATATLNIPVWNWGATRSKVRQSTLRRKLASLQLTTAQKTLLSELQSFYNEAETARAELDILRNSVDLAADSLRLTTLRYRSGEATVLEVVDAQNTLTTARNAFDDGQTRYRVALSNLQTLTGTL